MTTTLLVILVFATLMFVAAVIGRRSFHRLQGELGNLKTLLNKANKENALLMTELVQIKKKGGISESSVLSIIGDISRIDNNLYHMHDVPGRKQIQKSLERMKVTFQAEDYTLVPLLGTPYREGMQVSAVFVPDETLPLGRSIITSVQKPQVNRAGRMIQAATVTVGQNV